MWPYASSFLGVYVKDLLQPLLNEAKPAVLSCLELEQITLGDIAPKILGIRFLNTTDSVIRLDVELRWAGNANVSILIIIMTTASQILCEYLHQTCDDGVCTSLL